MRWFVLLSGALGLALASCSGDSGAVARDAGHDGSATGDAGPGEAGPADAGLSDGGPPDAAVDAGDLGDAGSDGGGDDAGSDGGARGDAGSGCSDCHGDATSPAPPAAIGGSTDTATRGVGAHRSHLGASLWHREIVCEDCHLVPTSLRSPGHADSRRPAELTWSALARANMATPSFDGARCSGAYCHGATLLPGGTVTAPAWTTVDGSQAACGTCHGLPPGGTHPASSACSTCHPTVDAARNITDPARHIDGTVDVGPLTCTTCHGDAATGPAPPADTGGGTATTRRGVGAHASHLRTSTWRRAIACTECHLVPATVASTGHLDTALPAELTFGPLARADMATPSFDGARCSGAYCHGATLLPGGTVTAPAWTTVDGSQAACGTCHGISPPPPHPVVSPADCSGCHPFAGLAPLDAATHINGTLEVNATCGACHALPPATGAHRRHFGVGGTPPSVAYGDLRAVADYEPGGSPEYMFGCGNCHPTDEARHRNGAVDVLLYEASAPATSLKAKNAPTAAYAAGRCSGVYCHSSGQQTPAFVASPPWTGSFTGLRCASCHGNPPAYPSGGAGTPTANSHVVLADDGWELGHFDALPGPWHGADHGPAVAAPLTCQACHYATVDPANVGPGGFYYLDTEGVYDLGGSLGYRCPTCHTGAVGAPATGRGAVLTARHVDGRRDVVFDPRTSIPPAVTGLPTGANRPAYPYWVTATPASRPPSSTQNGTTWSLNLASASYDPATKICSAVPCHLSQSFGTGLPMYDPLRWGVVPVGSATCNACHQF